MATKPRLHITKRAVDALSFVPKGEAQQMHWDDELAGFGVCIGHSAKSYIAQHDVNGRTIRITIGKHGVFTPEEARREARDYLNRMARGEDPRETKRRQRSLSLTLDEAWEECRSAHAWRKQTESDYRRVVEHFLADWRKRPLAEITGQMVLERHADHATRHSPGTATRNMRVFRAIYNFAMVSHEELPPNPTARLSRLRLWHRDQRRRTYIKSDDLPAWYEAVMALETQAARDYLRLVLFTGMRRSEALGLRWENVDLVGKTLTVPMTKNGDPLVLPLSSFVHDLLAERRRANPSGEWVFAAESDSGHLVEPKKWVSAAAKNSGVQFTLHDLRRTFITIAESLDLSAFTLKRLLNHRDGGRDVTSGYIVLDVERLRAPMQRISDFISSACKITSGATVQELSRGGER
jgi:integrase